MKKFLAILLALIMVLSLAACAGKDTGKDNSTGNDAADSGSDANSGAENNAEASGDKWKVTLIVGDFADESQVYMGECFERYAPDYNIEPTVLDGQADPQKQTQQVTNCIAQGVDAIILCPSDSAAVGPAVAEAHDAGIVTVFCSADIDEMYADYRDCYCGPNDTDSGVKGAEQLMAALPDGGKVVEVGGQASHIGAILRHEGFTATVEGSNIEVLEYQACQEWNAAQAMAIMEDFITKYGDEIQGVYCHWDNGASGCIEAFKNAGMEIPPIVAVDGCNAGYDQVKNGTQYASIAVSYETMYENACRFINDKLSGNDTSYLEDGWWYRQDWDVYNAETVDSFERPSW